MDKDDLITYFMIQLQRELTMDEKYILHRTFSEAKNFELNRILGKLQNFIESK